MANLPALVMLIHAIMCLVAWGESWFGSGNATERVFLLGMAILLLSAARNEERWAAKEETTDAKP